MLLTPVNLFLTVTSFMPHGMCYLWKPGLVAMHLIGNGATALAYFSIPLTLVYILRQRRDIPFHGIFLLFAAFILFCGLGHGFDIWTLWHPNYWVSGIIRIMTAIVSLATAIALIQYVPQILTLPSPQQMAEANRKIQQEGEELRQQEQFLRSIYDSVCEAIFVVDVSNHGEFRYQGFNPAAERLTGVKNVTGKTPAQILSPEAAATVEERYRYCLNTKQAVTYEECLPFNGEDTWWITSLNPIADGDGNIYRLIGTSLNISDRKRVEAELNEEKQFLQTLLDNLSDGIVACDENCIITLFNRASCELYGLPSEPIPSEQWSEYYKLYDAKGEKLLKPEEVPLFRAFQGESVRNAELMTIPKQGKPRSLLANGDPILNSQGKKIGAIVAVRDISERKQAEAALARSEERWQLAVASTGDGIWDWNVLTGEVYYSPRWLEMRGITSEDLESNLNDWKKRVHPEDYDRIMAALEAHFEHRVPFNLEYRTIHSDGSERWILDRGQAVWDETGKVVRMVGAETDITERKQDREALSNLNAALEIRVQQRTAQLERLNAILITTSTQLEKRNQELDQFAYVVSHDLKAPLRAIANLSTWIEEDLEDKLDDDTRYNLKLLRGRVQRLDNLINGLLVYSRVGRLKSKPKQVVVSQLLADVIELLDVPTEFTIEISGIMPTLITEELPLQQVFSNLISNAIKHHPRTDGKVTISATEQDDFYEFAVTDDGLGIDPKYHERIFTIFQTLEARDNTENTGIGLSIVKKAVETQGGIIAVESQINKGTTFRFTWKKSAS